MLLGSPRIRSRGIAVPNLLRSNLFLVSRGRCPRRHTCGTYRVVSFVFCFEGWECTPPYNLFVVDSEAEGLLKVRVPHAVQPHAVVVRSTLYMRGLKARFLQSLDCVFALFLCHCSLFERLNGDGLSFLDRRSARDLLCLTSSASCILESSTTMLKMSLLFMVVDLIVSGTRLVVWLLVVSSVLGGGGTGCDGDGHDDSGGHDVSQTFHCSLNFRKLG